MTKRYQCDRCGEVCPAEVGKVFEATLYTEFDDSGASGPCYEAHLCRRCAEAIELWPEAFKS